MCVLKPKQKLLLKQVTSDTDNPINQSKLKEHAADAERGKTYASESRLALFSPLIG